jgi:hypothetical protein
MFSWLFPNSKESFDNPGKLNDRASVGTRNIQQFFAQTLPNAIFGGDMNLDIDTMTKTTNARLSDSDTGLKNIQTKTNVSGTLLNERQAQCEAVGSGDQFDHLVSLASSQDPQSRLRCGWVYNNQNPNNGRGAYGSKEGPLNTSANGTWMWNLREAQEKFHKSICDQVTHCKDLDAPMFKGRCGWCSASGKAVPILGGKIAYPYNPVLNCSSKSLSTAAGFCPKPKAISPLELNDPKYARSPAQICDPLTNGSLARDCLIQKAVTAGCSDKGTLIQALKSGSDTNYIDVLSQSPAYVSYQQRATIGFNETALRNGKFTVSQAIDEFKRVNEQASSSLNGGLQYAARDLCFKKGEYDSYDFCLELADSTVAPYAIECLQKEFARAGGQKTGSLYPSANTLSFWNSLNKWLDVKAAIKTLSANVNSKNRLTQETAFKQFYGITLQNKTKPSLGSIPGVEIFWFTHQMDVSWGTPFLGRRIRSTIPFINQNLDVTGRNGTANNTDLKSMVFFANLYTPRDKTVNMRITSDDGFALELNRNMVNYTNNMNLNNSNQLINTGYFPPTTFTTKAAWSLSGVNPNVLSGYWFNGFGGLYYKLEIQDGQWSEIPASMLNLTQEAFSPMLSFEIETNPGEYGCHYPFCDRRFGGYKIQWGPHSWGAPPIKYAGDSADQVTFPFGKNYFQFPLGQSGIGGFLHKMYSFMTLTALITIRSIPAPGTLATPIVSWGEGGIYPCVSFTGEPGGKTARVNTGTRPDSGPARYGGVPPMSTDGPVIEKDVPYLIVWKILRSNESDISSLYGYQVGAAKLTDLQKSPSAYKESSKVVYPAPLEDPNSPNANFMWIQSEFMAFDLFWIHCFDYSLSGVNLQREANNDWLYLGPSD